MVSVVPALIRARRCADGHGIQIKEGLHRGRLLLQFYGTLHGAERGWFYYSDDHGSTWQVSSATEPVRGDKLADCAEESLVELFPPAAPGELMVACRKGTCTNPHQPALTRT
jgi:hypothetical protein